MVMITYSTYERNNGRLNEIKDELSKLQIDFRVDDTRDDTNVFGIAPGDIHQERIAEAILSANLVLVLGSHSWWESSYCMWEFEFARRAGKRIAIFPIGYGEEYEALRQKAEKQNCFVIESIEQLGSILQIGAELAEAHAELLRLWHFNCTRKDGIDLLHDVWSIRDMGFWDAPVIKRDAVRLSKDPVVVNCAKIVLAGSTMERAVGLTLNSEIISLAASVTGHASRRQRVRAVMGIGLLTAIIFLSVVSIFLRDRAWEEEKRAEEEALYQRSILLADRALEQENSFAQQILAEQAWQSAATDNAKNALTLAELENSQVQSFRIPQGYYTGAMFTPDADFLVVGEQNNLYVANLSNGKVEKRMSLDFDIAARQIACSRNADQIAVVNSKGNLVAADLQDNIHTELVFDSATAFCADNADRLWVAHRDGHISVSERPWSEKNSIVYQTEADMPTAMLVTEEGSQVAVLLADGSMQIYEIQKDTLCLIKSVVMFTGETRGTAVLGDGTSMEADALVQAGDNIAALRYRHVSVWKRDADTVEYDDLQLNTRGSLVIPASLGGAVITYQGVTNTARVYPKGSANPLELMNDSLCMGEYILAGIPRGKILAVVQNNGLVQIVHVDNMPLLTGSPRGFMPVPTSRGVCTLMEDGRLYSKDDGVALDIGENIQLGGSLYSGDYFFTITQSGRLVAVDTETLRMFQSDEPPMKPVNIYTGSNKEWVLVYHQKGYCVYRVAKDGGIALVQYNAKLSVLGEQETINCAAVNKDGSRIALTTSCGRVLVLAAENDMLLSERTYISAGYRQDAAFNDLGQLLVVSAGGRICLYDENLNFILMTILDKPIMGICSANDSSLGLIKYADGTYATLDMQGLSVVQEVPCRSGNMSFWAFDLQRRKLWINCVFYEQTGETSYVTRMFQYKLRTG